MFMSKKLKFILMSILGVVLMSLTSCVSVGTNIPYGTYPCYPNGAVIYSTPPTVQTYYYRVSPRPYYRPTPPPPPKPQHRPNNGCHHGGRR